MKNTLLVLAILLLSTNLTFAADTTKTGILLDAMCGEMSASDADDLSSHKVLCALMPNCQESGFGIVVEGTFLKFGDAGDEKALAFLKGTQKKSAVKIAVTGEFSGDNVKVATIKEAN